MLTDIIIICSCPQSVPAFIHLPWILSNIDSLRTHLTGDPPTKYHHDHLVITQTSTHLPSSTRNTLRICPHQPHSKADPSLITNLLLSHHNIYQSTPDHQRGSIGIRQPSYKFLLWSFSNFFFSIFFSFFLFLRPPGDKPRN